MAKEGYFSKIYVKIYQKFQRSRFGNLIKSSMYYVDRFLTLFIKKPKKVQNKRKQVLIIYNLAFGDGVIWLCSANEYRNIYPKDKFEITLMCQKGLETIYKEETDFDNIIPLDFNNATIKLGMRIKIIKKIREKYYDIVIDPIGPQFCSTNVLMTRNSVALEKITVVDESLCKVSKRKIKKTYTKVIKTRPKLSLLEFYSELIRYLKDKDFKVSLRPLKRKKVNLNLPKKYFIVFPSASNDLKNWPLDRYKKIIEKIYDKIKLPLVFCGTNADRKNVDLLKEKINIPYFDFVGKSSLYDFINIVSNASLVITNDTSTYHIAVVSEVPVAIICGGYTYTRYVAYHFENEKKYRRPCTVVNFMDCFDCENNCKFLKKSDKIWPCLEKVDVDMAYQKISKYIDKELGDKNGNK